MIFWLYNIYPLTLTGGKNSAEALILGNYKSNSTTYADPTHISHVHSGAVDRLTSKIADENITLHALIS